MSKRNELKKELTQFESDEENSYENQVKLNRLLEDESYENQWNKESISDKVKAKMEEWKISGPEKDIKGFIKALLLSLFS